MNTDVQEMCARLRKPHTPDEGQAYTYWLTWLECASQHLEAQAKRIEQLEAALRETLEDKA